MNIFLARVLALLSLLLATTAARAGTFTVTTTADEFDTPSGANVSLREALRDAAAAGGADTITFAPALSGQTISLDSTIAISDASPVTVDATGLPDGVTIDDGTRTYYALFTVASGSNVTFRGVTLANGGGSGFAGNGGAINAAANTTLTLDRCILSGNSAQGFGVVGGAIASGGTLTLTKCTLSGNSATTGGAISSGGSLTLTQCTLSGNSAVNGGALHNTGTLTATQCTLSGNSATNGSAMDNPGTLTLTQCTVSGNTATGGGAIHNPGMVTLTQCTLSGNSALNGGAIHNTSTLIMAQCTLSANSATSGGAIYSDGTALTMTNTIIGANTATNGPDMFNTGVSALISSGKNLIGNTSGSNLSGPAIVIGPPNLGPLDSYGGPTKTMALLPASLARNGAQGSTFTSDQRGFPIVGVPDIGAYEAGTFLDFNAYAAETSGVALTLTGDADKDGRSDLLEFATMTDPRVANFGEIPSRTFTTGAGGIITGATVGLQVRLNSADLFYTLQSNASLNGAWTPVATYNGATNVTTVAAPASATINGSGQITVTDPGPNGQTKYFYRLQVQKVPKP